MHNAETNKNNAQRGLVRLRCVFKIENSAGAIIQLRLIFIRIRIGFDQPALCCGVDIRLLIFWCGGVEDSWCCGVVKYNTNPQGKAPRYGAAIVSWCRITCVFLTSAR